jgi:hypothetical protein
MPRVTFGPFGSFFAKTTRSTRSTRAKACGTRVSGWLGHQSHPEPPEPPSLKLWIFKGYSINGCITGLEGARPANRRIRRIGFGRSTRRARASKPLPAAKVASPLYGLALELAGRPELRHGAPRPMRCPIAAVALDAGITPRQPRPLPAESSMAARPCV